MRLNQNTKIISSGIRYIGVITPVVILIECEKLYLVEKCIVIFKD